MSIGRRKLLIGTGAAAVIGAGAAWAGLRGMGSMPAYGTSSRGFARVLLGLGRPI